MSIPLCACVSRLRGHCATDCKEGGLDRCARDLLMFKPCML